MFLTRIFLRLPENLLKKMAQTVAWYRRFPWTWNYWLEFWEIELESSPQILWSQTLKNSFLASNWGPQKKKEKKEKVNISSSIYDNWPTCRLPEITGGIRVRALRMLAQMLRVDSRRCQDRPCVVLSGPESQNTCMAGAPLGLHESQPVNKKEM